MKKINLLIVLLMLLIQPTIAQQNFSPEDLKWKLGAQAYTFKNFTFAEALDKMRSIGLKYVEAFPGQKIGNNIEGTMHYNMDAATRKQVKDLLKSKGIKLVAYGVVSGSNEQEWRKLLGFARNEDALRLRKLLIS